MSDNKDTYFVAVKVFIQNNKGDLLITKDIFNDKWDIPGGRLREIDFDTDLKDVVKRKMQEELGDSFKYELGEVVLFMRHERDELLPYGEKDKRRIFAIGYKGNYIGGDIKLGKHHEKYEWVDLKTFVPEDYFEGGWLKGVKEFQSDFN